MTTVPVASSKLKNYKFSENSFLPRTVTVILRSEKKSSYKCLVRPGDFVEEGEVIARPSVEASLKACIHSPVPGKVLDILPTYCADGSIETGVKIQFGGKFNYLGKIIKEQDLGFISQSQIIKNLTENGIINTFDIVNPVSLGEQISNIEKKNPVIVVRLFDDDTTMLCDSLYTKFFFQEIVKGARALAKAIDASGILFAVNSKHGLKQKLEAYKDDSISFFEVSASKYPAGNSKSICRLYSKCKHKPEAIKAISIKDVFVDSGTMHEVYKSVYLGIPSVSHYVHFSGNCIPVSCFLNIVNGTSLEEIVGQLSHFVKTPARIIINGQLRGNTVTALDVPVSKNVKSVYFFSSEKIMDNYIYQCVNCGNCRLYCPQQIAPDLLYNYSIGRIVISENVRKSAGLCTQCNLCNSVCPSRLPLSQAIAVIKTNSKGSNDNEK